jgi:hypothetical protein
LATRFSLDFAFQNLKKPEIQTAQFTTQITVVTNAQKVLFSVLNYKTVNWLILCVKQLIKMEPVNHVTLDMSFKAKHASWMLMLSLVSVLNSFRTFV